MIFFFFFLFVCFSSPSSAWDQNAERQTVPCSDRSCAEQGGWVHIKDHYCCSRSGPKGSSYGINHFVWATPFKLLFKVELFKLCLLYINICILTSEPVPTRCGCTTAASCAISFYPSFCRQRRPWYAILSFFAQCSPSFHEAFLPPTCSSRSDIDYYFFFKLVFHPDYFFFPRSLPGFHPHQPFQPQLTTTGRPATFPLTGPSVPAANLSGPPLQPPSSTPGGLPPMPSPGVPPTSFMPPTSLPSSLMSPTSQTGAALPVYPGSLQNQPGPPMAPGPFAPPGSGYPQGGPGAPAVKLYQPPPVAPPPTGTAGIVVAVIILMFLLTCL